MTYSIKHQLMQPRPSPPADLHQVMQVPVVERKLYFRSKHSSTHAEKVSSEWVEPTETTPAGRKFTDIATGNSIFFRLMRRP